MKDSLTQVYKGFKIELSGNVLGLWNLYLNGLEQTEMFTYSFEAISQAKKIIDSYTEGENEN